MFLGYLDQYKGYRCLDITTNKILSPDTSFTKTNFPFQTNSPSPSDTYPEICPFLLQPVSTSIQQTKNITSVTPPVQLPDKLITQPFHPATLPNLPTTPSLPIQDMHVTSTHSIHPMVTRQKIGNLKPRIRLNLFHTDT